MAHEQPPIHVATGSDVRTRRDEGEIIVERKVRGRRGWIELKRCRDLGRGAHR